MELRITIYELRVLKLSSRVGKIKAAVPLQNSGSKLNLGFRLAYFQNPKLKIQNYLRRRRAAKPAKASKLSVAVVGSGMLPSPGVGAEGDIKFLIAVS